jgi:acetyl esterase/lipase
MPGPKNPKPESQMPDKGDQVTRIINVGTPTLTVYQAPATIPAPAMIISPGGGYGGLAYNKEGTEIAAWLNSLGITGIVLKYRVPGRDGAFQDLQRALRLARLHAKEWNIDSAKLGIIGFSAGGHLSARLSTNYESSVYPAIDDADQLICRPDYVVLVYPAYLEVDGKLAPEIKVSTNIPPTLIVHTEDDHAFVQGSKLYHAALDEAKVVNEFQLFPTGGHGYGLRSNKDVKVWPDRCADWLHKLGILK